MAGDRGTLNILITAASRRVALIRAFRESLARLGVAGKVVSTDINPLSPGLFFSDRACDAPLTSDPGYLDRIEQICREERISAVIPTFDEELALMGAARKRFADAGVTIVISSPKTCEACGDKWLTFELFQQRGIPTPRSWLPEQLDDLESVVYPLFVKPRNGRGSVNAFAARSERELRFFLEYVPDPIVQEYLDGPEYTLDAFADFDGRVISVVPRRRLWVRSGVMDKGRTEKRDDLIALGAEVAERLGIIGPANIQVRFRDGEPCVFEVNPRFSGGIPLTLRAGADFTEWICRLLLGEQLKPRFGEFEDGLVMMSYEENIFRSMDVGEFERIKKLIE